MEEVLPTLLAFADSYNTEVVHLVDWSLLAKKKVSEDAEIARFVLDLIIETQEYERSVIIFDLDSIAMIEKQYGNLTSDLQASDSAALEQTEKNATFSYHCLHPHTFRTVLEAFSKLRTNRGCWMIAVSRNNKLTLDFKDHLSWPLTHSIEVFKDEEHQKDKKMRCDRCYEITSIREN